LRRQAAPVLLLTPGDLVGDDDLKDIVAGDGCCAKVGNSRPAASTVARSEG
jgi:hypothetical protein